MAARPRIERASGHRIEGANPDHGDGGDEQKKRPIEQEQLLLEQKLGPLESLGEYRPH
jgi:hypothetical protein